LEFSKAHSKHSSTKTTTEITIKIIAEAAAAIGHQKAVGITTRSHACPPKTH
jgi:hypothetical protein